MIKDCFQTIAASFVEFYNVNGEQKTLDFVFGSKFSLSVLESVYINIVKDNPESEITKVSEVNKLKYWNIACKYYQTLPDRLKASKAAYVLELITSTYEE
jgi:hypothetical protein